MMPENNKNFNGDNEPLKSDESGNDDRLQDTSNSDAAVENAMESERIQEASRAAVPSYQLDTDTNNDQENRGNANDDESLTTQGSDEEVEENLSGTTNLTLEQLKKEGDPGGYGIESEEE